MKKTISLFISLFFIGIIGHTQGITGDWYGALDIYGQSLRIRFHIKQTDEGLLTTMDSPDQQAFGIKVDRTEFKKDSLFLNIAGLNASYKGKFVPGKKRLSGTFEQNGLSLDLDMSRDPVSEKKPKRPQE